MFTAMVLVILFAQRLNGNTLKLKRVSDEIQYACATINKSSNVHPVMIPLLILISSHTHET